MRPEPSTRLRPPERSSHRPRHRSSHRSHLRPRRVRRSRSARPSARTSPRSTSASPSTPCTSPPPCILRAFDQGGGWSGVRSCAHWLAWRVGWDLGTARERLRVARALTTLPKVSAALGAGAVSYSKVRAITRAATPATEELLLGYVQHSTAGQLETIAHKLGAFVREDDAHRALAAGLPPLPPTPERYGRHRVTPNHMVAIGATIGASTTARTRARTSPHRRSPRRAVVAAASRAASQRDFDQACSTRQERYLPGTGQVASSRHR